MACPHGRLSFRRYDQAELDWSLDAIGAGRLARAMASWTMNAAVLAGSGQGLEVWRADRAGEVAGLCLSGEAHLTILRFGRHASDPARRNLPEVLAHELREVGQHRSMLGPPELVRATCAAFGRPWQHQDRTDHRYLFMTLDHSAESVSPDPLVQLARDDDFGPVLDASISAATEAGTAMGEPTRYFSRHSAIAEALSERRCLVRFDGDEVIFKAEAVPVSADLCLIHGVWIAPSHRGRGISVGAAASVAEYGLRSARAVGLFVDAGNEPARRCYQRVGFCPAGSVLHATLPGGTAL